MAAAPLRHEVFYPESDGKPMAETGLHVNELFKLYGLLKEYFRLRVDVYLTANMFLYFIEGDPRSCVAPDLFVAKGVDGNHERRTWQVWREGRPPCFVLEVTSDSTRRIDLHKKKDIYARIGVAEYFLFDLLGDYLKPPLQGFELAGERYRPMAPLLDGALVSKTLGLTFRPTGEGLRLFETATGEPLLGLPEVSAKLGETTARLEETTATLARTLTRFEAMSERLAEMAERFEAESAARRALEERLARLEGR